MVSKGEAQVTIFSQKLAGIKRYLLQFWQQQETGNAGTQQYLTAVYDQDVQALEPVPIQVGSQDWPVAI